MDIRYIIYTLVLALFLTSCHSQRRVIRGSEGHVRGEGVEIQSPEVPPHYTGDADNKITSRLMDEAYSWIGTPYLYGGKDKKGADCSGYVMVVYHNALGIELPRVSRDQGEYCKRIKKEDLFPGDLVFFVTGSNGKVSHVGIYIGDGKMIHASSTKGVIVTDITTPYYVKHLHHYGRVTEYYDMLTPKKGKKRK